MKRKKTIAAALCAALLAGCSRGIVVQTGQQTEKTDAWQIDAESQTEAWIYVHVSGAVARPGVVHLQSGARLFEAVSAAGGFTAEADRDWCNQAMILCDEDRVQIYTLEETASMAEQGVTSEGVTSEGVPETDDAGDGLVHLNTASREELMTLPGIGQRRAEEIIDYRSRTGGFSSLEELMQISGIGSAVFGKLADRIAL